MASDVEWYWLVNSLWSIHEQGWALLAATILISAGALAAPFIHDRLALLMVIGLVGYGSAVLFLFAGAPDVAFTQFMVETVLVVVAAAVLHHYGRPSRYSEPRLLNATIAIAAGVGTFILLAHMFSNSYPLLSNKYPHPASRSPAEQANSGFAKEFTDSSWLRSYANAVTE